ncbi:MAG: BatA domain-containing protein [Planctomycetia bacterium]|nr:BatA domain-containing protein [Planctomycetia bacterium]
MNFIAVSFLLGGIIAAAIPVILHLMMRGRSRRIEFPALQFLRSTIIQNKRKYTLRHLLLLLMRAALILLLGLALARPFYRGTEETVSGGSPFRHLPGNTESPIAAALVFDTSIRMNCTQNNKTRLDAAKEIGRALLARFPAESRIAILDSSSDHDAFQIDLTSAKDLIGKLTIKARSRSLPESIREGVRLLNSSDLSHRELIVFTDRTNPSWPERQKESLRQAIKNVRQSKESGDSIAHYLVDCGQPIRENSSIRAIILPAETIPSGKRITLEVETGHLGLDRADTLELYLAAGNRNGKEAFFEKAQKKSVQTIEFKKEETRKKSLFQLADLAPGFYQGAVRFTGGDSFAEDNVRWFSLDIRSNGMILLAAPDPVEEKSLFVREALAPEEYRKLGIAPFEVKSIPQSDLKKLTPDDLKAYQAIFLLDPAPLDDSLVDNLFKYTESGGGLGIFFGRNAVPVNAFRTESFVRLIGGTLTSQVRIPDGDTGLKPVNWENSVLAPFRSLNDGENVPWGLLSVNRYWQIADLAPDAIRILDYTDGRPAIYTRSIGRGTLLVSSSPFSDLPNDSSWNQYPYGEASWVFIVLMDGMARHLLSGGLPVLNYLAGENAILRPSHDLESKRSAAPGKGILYLPDCEKMELTPDEGGTQFRFPGTAQTGSYFFQPLLADSFSDTGFSVNYSAEDFDLKEISRSELDKYLEGTGFQWLDNEKEMESARARQNLGQEYYPVLIVLFALLLIGEYVFANKFYR